MNEDLNNGHLNSVITYFKLELRSKTNLTEEVIEDLILNDTFFGEKLSTEDRRYVKRKLLASLDITQNKGYTIKSDCKPWLAERKSKIDFYYWGRLRDYMMATDILPPNVISTLDTVTDEILDCSGNPADETEWAQRGMVIGHVQSGKTTNYSALITKAADAGYKIIILLAGITNSLRSQTQQRLDKYFIGRKSVFQATAQEPMEILQFCEDKRDPAYGTSVERDFNKQSATSHGVSLSSLAEPMIFITKKNKSTLESLNTWIKDQHHGKTINYPLLLIDDEADHASINTHKDPGRATAINISIREILSNFSRSTYIGYTATPFANIFIQPDSNEDMEHEDIFPRNFIKALVPPTNYSGAKRIFSATGDLYESTVNTVGDYADILPVKHKKDHHLEILPPSLYTAIRVFLLAKALRYLRGQKNEHCSMMINVSRFNDVQAKVEGLVYIYLQELKSAIAVSARAEDALKDPVIKELESDFDTEFKSEFKNVEFDFVDLLAVLHESSTTVDVTTVNMRGGKLDYEKHKKTGLHIIVIGGLALSRGLTLEGLTVTYILRNVSASDTLMQMARWFGYHPDYERLCRIYFPESSLEHYRHTHIAIEELCSEVYRMEQSGMTPYQFGLKVRQSPTGIRITAANKMRSASALKLAQDFSGQHTEAHSIFNDKAKKDQHKKITAEFLKDLGNQSPKTPDHPLYPYWIGVPGNKITSLIEGFHFPETVVPFARISGSRSLILDYISDRVQDELKLWDVAIPGPQKPQLVQLEDLIPGLKLNPRRRESGALIRNNIFRITKNNRVADPNDGEIGLTDREIKQADAEAEISGITGVKKYCVFRKRPLLIIHVFGADNEAYEKDGFTIGAHNLSLSICLPSTQTTVLERTYQVNEVFRRSLMAPLDEETDEDEEAVMEEI
jgi:hypothetical protein